MSDITLETAPQPLPAASFRRYRDLFSRYMRPLARPAAGMAVVLLAGIALQLANPQVVRFFLDTAQAGGALRSLMIAAALYIFFALLQQGLNMAAGYTSKSIGWEATNRLRADLALHCLRLDMPFHKQHTPGELIERLEGDVTHLANFLSAFAFHVLGNGLLVLGILVMLFIEDVRVGAAMLVYTAVTLLVLNADPKNCRAALGSRAPGFG